MSRKKQIQTWLDGPQTFEEGLALYKQYGANSALLSIFQRSGPTTYNCEKLEQELSSLLSNVANQQKRVVAPVVPEPEPVSAYDPRVLALIRARSHYHAQLTAVGHEADRMQLAFQILDLTDKIEILLGVKAAMARPEKPADLPTDRAEMVKRLQNNRSYISRYKSSPLQAAEVQARVEENEAIFEKLNGQRNGSQPDKG